jgi:hypothetical protein
MKTKIILETDSDTKELFTSVSTDDGSKPLSATLVYMLEIYKQSLCKPAEREPTHD